jgi:hypothetical protein
MRSGLCQNLSNLKAFCACSMDLPLLEKQPGGQAIPKSERRLVGAHCKKIRLRFWQTIGTVLRCTVTAAPARCLSRGFRGDYAEILPYLHLLRLS